MTATIETHRDHDVQPTARPDADRTPPAFSDVGVLFQIQEAHGIYLDAWCVDDSHRLVFGSFWGRDTAINGLLARLSLPLHDGGLNSLTVVDCADAGSRHAIRLDHVEQLQKLTGRMPKANLFGDLVQLWLYDRLLMTPDRATRRSMLLVLDPELDPLDDPGLWTLFQTVCHLPMLDHWRQPMLTEAKARDWLRVHAGHRVSAVMLNLGGDDVEPTVTEMIHVGTLALEAIRPDQPTIRTIVIPIQRGDDGGNEEEPDPEPKNWLTAEELRDALGHFHGTDKWYRHWLGQMLYTDGVEFFAEQGGRHGAYWFLDIAATECLPLLKQEGFLHLKLTVADGKAELVTDDGNGNVLHRRAIEYTDLQPGEWRFYLTDNVLLLTSEY